MAGRRYRKTPARRAALRKAQLASARKRKGRKLSPVASRRIRRGGKIAGAGVLAGTAVVGAVVGAQIYAFAHVGRNVSHGKVAPIAARPKHRFGGIRPIPPRKGVFVGHADAAHGGRHLKAKPPEYVRRPRPQYNLDRRRGLRT